jgi:zinc protease
VRQLAETYYGGIASRPVAARKPRTEPAQVGVRRLDFKAPAEQASLSMAYKVPGLTALDPRASGDSSADADALALTVLAAVLDGYSGARLERALTQGDDRVADNAGAYNRLWGRGPQLFILGGVPAQGKTALQVEAGLRAQIARVAQGGVTEAELSRVKTQWVAGEVYKRDSVFNQARELGSHWALGLPLDAGDRVIERLRAVTAEQVKAVAAKYFGDDQLTVAVLQPQPLDTPRKPRTLPAGSRH